MARAREYPEALALRSAYGACTYGELDTITCALARLLAAHGAGPGETVAILTDRRPALVFGMLGVLRSGATLLIVDASYPEARVLACLGRTEPAVLLVPEECALPEALAARIPRRTQRIALPSGTRAALCALAHHVDGPPLPEVDPSAAAYVSFTSGSTGEPKGIVTGHAPLPHFVDWHVAHGGLTRSDRFSMLSGLSHDPLLRDVLTPLSLGASLHVPAQQAVFDADALFRWLADERISVAHLTPALGEILVAGAGAGERLDALRRVYWGGDTLSAQLVARVRELAPSALQTNCYGATETPQIMACHDVTHAQPDAPIPLGCGIAGAQLLVVDERGRLCEPGQLGEIWVRSAYLSRGYLNDPEATRARFVPNPFRNDPDDLCYRTGDLGRYRSDGAVLFAGRADHQIKIRGFRVEPAEIVRALEALPGVTRAVVLAPEVRGERQLMAYVAVADPRASSASSLRAQLAGTLPSYMLPKHVVPLARLPLLPSGKVDLGALPPPADDPQRSASKRLPRNETERKLAAAWAEVLGVEEVGIDDSFLELGGDSLSAIRALSRMRRLGLSDDVARGIFQGKTIAELTSGKADTQRPLAGRARTTLLINVLRGLLVLLLVVDHWRGGALKRLQVPDSITAAIEFVFHLPTPGFAFVFGLGLGYTHYEGYLRSPSASRRLLRGGALLLLGGTLLMGLSRNLGVVARGLSLDYDLFSTNFFLPTLYYGLALATVPLWFRLLATREGKWGGSLLAGLVLAGACRGLYELARFLLLEHEQRGLLQLGRLMLTARFSYFNLSTGALLGICFGLFLRRRATAPLVPQLLAMGGATLTAGLAIYLLRREAYPLGLMSPDIFLPEWLFYLGLTLLLAAAVEPLLDAVSFAPLRRALEWTGVLGQCAMPVFILQGMVLDVSAFGRALGLPDALAVAVALSGFVAIVGWMMWRVHALFYGSVAEVRAVPEAAPSPPYV